MWRLPFGRARGGCSPIKSGHDIQVDVDEDETSPGAAEKQKLMRGSTKQKLMKGSTFKKSEAQEAEDSRLLERLEKAVDKMPQNPVAEGDLQVVEWRPLFQQIGLNILGVAVFGSMAGAVEMKFRLKHFLVALGVEVLAFVVIVFLLTIVIETIFADTSLGPKLDGSRLWRGMRGKKTVRLENKVEVFAFTHAINRGQRGNLRVDTIRLDDDSSQNRVLFIRNNEIMPGKFKVGKMYKCGTKERLAIVDAYIADKTKPVPCEWFDDELLSLNPKDFPIHAELEHRDPRANFFDHPIVNMCVSVALTMWQLAPLAWWIYRIAQLKNKFCLPGGQSETHASLSGVDEATKVQICSSFWQFIDFVHGYYNLSWAEFIPTFVLAMTTLCRISVFRETLRFHNLQYMFFCFCRMPPEGVAQLRQYLALFTEFLNPFLVGSRIKDLFGTWLSPCRAVERLPSMKRSKPYNLALYRILKVVHMMVPTGDEVVAMELPFAEGERNPKDAGGYQKKLVTRAVQNKLAQNKWCQWKDNFSLWKDGARFKMMVIVPMTCKEAVHLFVTYFFKGEPYKDQLEEIFSRHGIQDKLCENESGVATRKAFHMGPICVPRGFVLTHMLVTPDDEDPHQIQVGKVQARLLKKPACVESRADFDALLMEGTKDVEMNALAQKMGFGIYPNFATKFSREETPQVVLPAAARMEKKQNSQKLKTRSQLWDIRQLRDQFGDDVAYSLSFVFQLTEGYYTSSQDHHTGEFSEEKYLGFAERVFGQTDYSSEEIHEWKANKKEKDEELLTSLCSQTLNDARGCKRVLVVKEHRWALLGKVMVLLKNIGLPWLMVLVVSILYGFFVPLYRQFVHGEDAFPEVIFWQMIWNSTNHAAFLFLFLHLFESETQRLGVISMALQQFERETMTPPKVSTGDSEESGPFNLYVNVEEEYKEDEAAGNEVWKRRWTQVGQNVENWDNCSTSMRVLVSTARLTSQIVLLLAALLLGSMVLMSVGQALLGQGAVDIDRDAFVQKVEGLMKDRMGQGTEHLAQAKEQLQLAMKNASAAGPAAAGAGRRLSAAAAAGASAAAMEELRGCFQPFLEELHSPLRSQLSVLAAEHRRLSEASPVANVDLSKATKTQALTMFFFVIIAVYSIRLVMHIASINSHVMNQEAVLIDQKSSHRKLQTARELDGEGLGEGSKLLQSSSAVSWNGVDVAASRPDAPGQPSRQESAEAADAAAATTPGGEQLVVSLAKDPAKKRYEKMLDMAIENARNCKVRFPLSLFGFVISKGMLVFWLVGLGVQVVQQGKTLAVPVARSGCDWIQDHPMHVGKSGTTPENADAALEVWEFLIDSLCDPIAGAMLHSPAQLGDQSLASKAARAAQLAGVDDVAPGAAVVAGGSGGTSPTKVSSRRLDGSAAAGLPAAVGAGSAAAGLPAAVGAWWARHPQTAPEAKQALLSATVREHEREAHRLLLAAPRAVHDAYSLGGLGPALDVALLQWGPEGQTVNV